MDRRQFVAAAGSVAAVAVTTSLRRALGAPAATAPTDADVTTRLNALFDEFMDERLRKNPEQATFLGLDKGKLAWAKSKLTDASLARSRELKQENASRIKRLQAFGRDRLGGSDLANYDTVMFQMETIARTEPFDFGELTRPYIIS